MCKPKTSTETAGQELLRLIQDIPDSSKDLRERIQRAVGDLELHKSYGLRFERHLPEVIDVDGEKIGLHTPYYPYLEHQESMVREKTSGSGKPEHMLLECDNYVGLKYLQYTHQGKVDVIYIDPPYNTGAKEWKYNDAYVDSNDAFRHSKWLSFMEKRIALARSLLSPDGILFISIDDNEVASLRMLVDSMLGRAAFLACIPWKKRSAKSDVPSGLSQDYEWVLVYAQSKFSTGKSINRKYYETKDFPGRPWRTHGMKTQRTAKERPNSNITLINPKTGEEYPADPNAVWRISKDTYPKYQAEGRIIYPGDYPFLKGQQPLMRYFKEDDDKKGNTTAQSTDISHLPFTGDGTKQLKLLFDGNRSFPFVKPVQLISHLIQLQRKKDAVVLDFFAGSGTTFQAVAELNAEDGGNRQCILMTNNEGNICEEVTWPRVSRVITGYGKYAGNPTERAAFYKVAIQPEGKIEKTMRGWKKSIEPYLPLISTKLNVPFDWQKIKDVKLGFISKDVAVIPDAAYLEWKWEGLKAHQIRHICIVGDDIEDYEGIQKALKKETSATEFTFLPRHYLEYFEGFHAKGGV